MSKNKIEETPTVYVVQVDYNKDLSDAKQYGTLQAVFANPRKPYDTDSMVAKARHILKDWQDGDYLLMVGDPALCAICTALVSELTCKVDLLSWDRITFRYVPQTWYFDEA